MRMMKQTNNKGSPARQIPQINIQPTKLLEVYGLNFYEAKALQGERR